VLFIWVQSTDVRPGGYKQGEIDMALNRFFVDQGEWWRIVTSGFLHFSVVHIAMNMLSLYFLGRLLEPVLPKGKFFLLYMASLLAGSAGVILLESRAALTGGASGAIFGLLGATAVAFRHRGVGLMQSGIGFTLIMNLVLTFTIPNISIGGPRRRAHRRSDLWLRHARSAQASSRVGGVAHARRGGSSRGRHLPRRFGERDPRIAQRAGRWERSRGRGGGPVTRSVDHFAGGAITSAHSATSTVS
jgi:membrane associated rhomboid family serine protease